jgi:hypothetical protein
MINCTWLPGFSSVIPCGIWNLLGTGFFSFIIVDVIFFVMSFWDTKFSLEADRYIHPPVVGVRIFNKNKVDFTERKAELMGYGTVGNDSPVNWINNIPHEERILEWAESEEKIEPGGHGFVKLAGINVDEGLLQYGNSRLSGVLNDTDSWRFEIEIRGKVRDKPVVRRCCVAFSTRKDIISDRHGTRIFWAITIPTLEKDAGWAKAYTFEEWEKIRKKHIIAGNILKWLRMPFVFLKVSKNSKKKRKPQTRKKASANEKETKAQR